MISASRTPSWSFNTVAIYSFLYFTSFYSNLIWLFFNSVASSNPYIPQTDHILRIFRTLHTGNWAAVLPSFTWLSLLKAFQTSAYFQSEGSNRSRRADKFSDTPEIGTWTPTTIPTAAFPQDLRFSTHWAKLS
jgi:hypothetical protein